MAKIALDRGSELELASGMVVEQQCYAQVKMFFWEYFEKKFFRLCLQKTV